jgi:hypothetical protein
VRDSDKSEDQRAITAERERDKSNGRCEIYAVYGVIEQYQV